LKDKVTVVSTAPLAVYQESKYGKTLYKVTSEFLGKYELASLLEDLAVRKILRSENAVSTHSA
jgi:hypothetical protein